MSKNPQHPLFNLVKDGHVDQETGGNKQTQKQEDLAQPACAQKNDLGKQEQKKYPKSQPQPIKVQNSQSEVGRDYRKSSSPTCINGFLGCLCHSSKPKRKTSRKQQSLAVNQTSKPQTRSINKKHQDLFAKHLNNQLLNNYQKHLLQQQLSIIFRKANIPDDRIEIQIKYELSKVYYCVQKYEEAFKLLCEISQKIQDSNSLSQASIIPQYSKVNLKIFQFLAKYCSYCKRQESNDWQCEKQCLKIQELINNSSTRGKEEKLLFVKNLTSHYNRSRDKVNNSNRELNQIFIKKQNEELNYVTIKFKKETASFQNHIDLKELIKLTNSQGQKPLKHILQECTENTYFQYFQSTGLKNFVQNLRLQQKNNFPFLNIKAVYVQLRDQVNWLGLLQQRCYYKIPVKKADILWGLSFNTLGIVIRSGLHVSEQTKTNATNLVFSIEQSLHDCSIGQEVQAPKGQEIVKEQDKYQKQSSNTLYMVLQCLHKSSPFLLALHTSILNKSQPKVQENLLTSCFLKLIQAMWRPSAKTVEDTRDIVKEMQLILKSKLQDNIIEILRQVLNVFEKQNVFFSTRANISGKQPHYGQDSFAQKSRGQLRYSLIEEIFTGSYRITQTCSSAGCRHKNESFANFEIHNLPLLYSTNKHCSLIECLHEAATPAIIKQKCQKCRSTTSLITTEVDQANKILIIGIDRFSKPQNIAIKLQVPQIIEVIDIARDWTNEIYHKKVYQLYAAIILRDAHYVAVTYDYSQNKWLEYDSRQIREISPKETSFEDSHILFYELSQLRSVRDEKFLEEYNQRTGANF